MLNPQYPLRNYREHEYCLHCFRELNDKTHAEVDSYGQVRYPYHLEATVKVLDVGDYTYDDPDTGGCGWAWQAVPKTPRYKSEREKIQPYIDEQNKAVLEYEKTRTESM